MKLVIILCTIVIVTIVISLLWRFFSQRTSLPCPTWLGWLVELENPFCRNNRSENIIAHLALQPGMTVLDLGCGPGRVTIPLARAVVSNGKVVAMDLQEGMLARTKEKARAAGLTNISFLHAPIGENKLEQEVYDRIVMVTVLGEIVDQKKAFLEIFSALKPGGILSITEVIFDPHFQGRNAVRRLATSIELKEKDFWGNRFSYTLNFEKPNK